MFGIKCEHYVCMIGIGSYESRDYRSKACGTAILVPSEDKYGNKYDRIDSRYTKEMFFLVEDGWVDNVRTWANTQLKGHCRRFEIIPSEEIIGKDIIRFVMEDKISGDTLCMRQYSEKVKKGIGGRMIKLEDKKSTLGRKKIYWSIRPRCFMKFDFLHCGRIKSNVIKEFYSYCENLTGQLGLKAFLTSYNTEQKAIKEKYGDSLVKPIHYHTNTILKEVDCEMNRGNRTFAVNQNKAMKVIKFDVNSMHSYSMLTGYFSNNSTVGSYKGLNNKLIFPSDVDAFVNAQKHEIKTRKCRIRYMLHVEKLSIKAGREHYGINLPESLSFKFNGRFYRDSSTGNVLRGENVRFGIIDEELAVLLENYDFDVIQILDTTVTYSGMFPMETRKAIWDSFTQALDAKKRNSPDKDFKKLLKNNIAGYYQNMRGLDPDEWTEKYKGSDGLEHYRTPNFYTVSRYGWKKDILKKLGFVNWEYGLDSNARELYALKKFQQGKILGNYSNVLAGAEITLRSRMLNRFIEKWFEDRGFKVVYSNCDSFAVCYSDMIERKKLEQAQHEYNYYIRNYMNKLCGDMQEYRDYTRDSRKYKYGEGIGELKIEDEGFIIHQGLNDMYMFNEDGDLLTAALAGFRWEEVAKEHNRIEDFIKGFMMKLTLKGVDETRSYTVVSDNLYTFSAPGSAARTMYNLIMKKIREGD